MSNSPKVRVTDGKLQYWYKNRVGEEFEVEEFNERFWALKEDLERNAAPGNKNDIVFTRLIAKENSEIVKE